MSATHSDRSSAISMSMSGDLEMIAFARMVVRRLLPPLDEVVEPMYYGALTEIATNAIAEHREQSIDRDIKIEVTLDPASVRVTDFGQGFDPDAIHEQRDDHSGLGLLITRAVVSDLEIDSRPDGTTVTLPYPVTDL